MVIKMRLAVLDMVHTCIYCGGCYGGYGEVSSIRYGTHMVPHDQCYIGCRWQFGRLSP